MAPKAVGLSQDEFLAACFRCSVDEIKIDFEKLAKMTGMSKGGAQNKFRDLKKKLDSSLTTTGTNDDPPPTTKPNKPTKPAPTKDGKRKTPDDEAAGESEQDGEVSAPEKPVAKKPRAAATKKGTAKAVKGGKKGGKVDAPIENGDEDVKKEEGDDAEE